MKIKLKNIRKGIRPNQVGIVKMFIPYLQEHITLNGDLVIHFITKRNQKITTGSEEKGVINVFTKSRILIDILRTLAHEWVHAYIEKTKKTKQVAPEKAEDMANAISGHLIRKFVEENPQIEVEVYKD